MKYYNQSSETFDTIGTLISEPTGSAAHKLWDSIIQTGVSLGINLLVATVIVVVGFWLVNRSKRVLKKIFEKRDIDAAVSLFLLDFFSFLFRMLVVITALYRLGIEMTSFVALLGGAGLAIGMAFSGALSNFAGGIIILVLRPYRIDDFVMSNGESGRVTNIQLFNTTLITRDNKSIIIPNSEIINKNIVNFTKQDKRRVDFNFGLSYGFDFDAAKKEIYDIVFANEKIYREPEPVIAIKELADSSVVINCFVWTDTENYWEVYFYLSESIYREMPKRGFTFPFPQLDVHLKQS
jgi:small conductance mechanosensitive channel